MSLKNMALVSLAVFAVVAAIGCGGPEEVAAPTAESAATVAAPSGDGPAASSSTASPALPPKGPDGGPP